MDPSIRQYADSLFEREQLRLVSEYSEEIRHQHQSAAARNMSQFFSGSEYQAMIAIHARYVGKNLSARLSSFSEAFAHAGGPLKPGFGLSGAFPNWNLHKNFLPLVTDKSLDDPLL